MAGTIAQVLGILVTCGALALASFGFATSHWQNIMVNRDKVRADIGAVQNPVIRKALEDVLDSDPAFTSRARGLYVTCYLLPDDGSITWPENTTFKRDSCVSETGYEINRQPSTVDYGPGYELRIQLMRCHYAFLGVAWFMLLFGSLGSALSCCCIKIKLLQLSGCFNFGGAFFCAAGIAFFHGFIYVEMTQINIPGFFYYYMARPALYRTLINNWAIGLGYSYILMWLAVGVAIIGAILYFIAASQILAERDEEEKKKLANERKLTGAPNPAYAAAEKEGKEESESESEEEPNEEEPEQGVVPVPVPYPLPVPLPSYPYPPPADVYNPFPSMYGGAVIPAAIIPPTPYPYYDYDYDMYNSRL